MVICNHYKTCTRKNKDCDYISIPINSPKNYYTGRYICLHGISYEIIEIAPIQWAIYLATQKKKRRNGKQKLGR
jgi:hypothetical protein